MRAGGACVPDAVAGLSESLAHVPDRRARRGVRLRLTVVVTAAVCAVVSGWRQYTGIARDSTRPLKLLGLT